MPIHLPNAIPTILRFGLAVMLGTAACQAADEEHEVKLKAAEVPAKVMETLKVAAKGAELGEFEKEDQHGKPVYTAVFTGKDGKEMEITVDPDGKLIGVAPEAAGEPAKPKE